MILISATYLVIDAMADRVQTCGGFDCAEIDRASTLVVPAGTAALRIGATMAFVDVFTPLPRLA